MFTCDWDDTSELFYYNDHDRYLVMLDPTFMYHRDPEVWRKWRAVAAGGMGERTHDVLREDFKVRYGVCSAPFSRLKGLISSDPRFEVVQDNGRVWLFRLKEP